MIGLEHTSQVLAGNPLGDPVSRLLPVLLPPGYHQEPDRRYPVIWVLAPFTSWGERFFNLSAWDENIAQRALRLMDSGQMAPAILVFPNCFTRYGGSQYLNSSAVGRYEDYLLDELIPFVDGTLRTLPAREHRGVLGYSSGGYGAFMLAMRHPDRFGAAASHSGDLFFDTCYRPDIPRAVRALESFGGVAAYLETFSTIRSRSSDWYAALNLVAMSACYSPNPASPHGFDLPFDLYTGELREEVWARWLALDPVLIASQHLDALRSLRAFYFDCGDQDEYNLFLGARRLHRLLKDSGIAHFYEEYEGGHHGVNWRYEISLPILAGALAPDDNG
ncbi:MAG: alpha/beta hydrolase-fold protein [Anaerolineae bacterium]